ncbi:unnamed protein product [Phyllotreta striolata]|uniref:Uncharacterized protein n=1 Tax=Phyllotreta striolata TaxID=444603 RepID=A0A9N9TLX6_PHYSR|nr:unnamed protein product [Phyllotreta striolata]
MSKKQILSEYKKNVLILRKKAKNLGLSSNEIENLFKQSFTELRNELDNSRNVSESNKTLRSCTNFRNLFVLLTIFLIFIYVLLNVHQPTSSIVLRNVQGLTYPTLKLVRFLSVPIIKLFPRLTDLYDETCLIENPYFYVSDMECWPCENVFTVLNLTKVEKSLLKSGYGTPFITKSNQQLVTLETMRELYEQNKYLLNSETKRLESTNSSYTTLESLFENNESFPSNTHISWRVTKMATARVVRQVFPKPFFLPDRSGQSVERFVIIDGPEADPYALPSTECSYVFAIQGSGERSIVLKPSKECSNNCRTISVVLKPSYILWYNWWYWRPISLPSTNSSEPSVTYINSYC